MTMPVEVYAGTAGHSVWFSADRGQSWVHPNSQSGLYLEARVWGMSSHPAQPDTLFAATDMGLFSWSESVTRWKAMPSPMADLWSIAQHPRDAALMFAGTRPARLYRSSDAGTHWQDVSPDDLSGFSEVNMGATRVTQLMVDPRDGNTVWATVEVGGIYRSDDGGLSWGRKCTGLVSEDIHGILVVRDQQGRKKVLVTTNRGLHASPDNGEHWQFQPLDSAWQYTRAIASVSPDDACLLLTNGNGPPGDTGALLRSDDHGLTWRHVPLPGKLNSTPWCIATHAANPQLVFMCTNLGQLFRSEDAGLTWTRLPHEFGEVRSLHWRPTNYPKDRPAHSVTVRLPVRADQMPLHATKGPA
jgi:photosystem II stability/assembly factor-like uncharacterized protein